MTLSGKLLFGFYMLTVSGVPFGILHAENLIDINSSKAMADNLTIPHATLSLALTLDERCQLMTPGERGQIESARQDVMDIVVTIPDVRERLRLLANSATLEDGKLEEVKCGVEARAIIDQALASAKKQQDLVPMIRYPANRK